MRHRIDELVIDIAQVLVALNLQSRYTKGTMPAQLPAVILSPDFSIYPRSLIGRQAWQIGQWLDQQLPLPETICLPQSTLEQVLRYNHRVELLKQLNQTSHQSEVYQQRWRSLAWPTGLKQELVRDYDHFLGGGFAKIWQENHPQQTTNHITGEANLLQSIMTHWLNYLDHLTIKGRSDQGNLFISRVAQADVSGVIFTRHFLSQHKFHYYIEAMPGVWSASEIENRDIYQVDARTQAVVYRQLRRKNQALRRVADGLVETRSKFNIDHLLVEDSSLRVLTKLAHRLAMRQFKPLKISWSIENRRLFIDEIETLDPTDSSLKPTSQQSKPTLPQKIFLELNSFNQITKTTQLTDQLIVSYQTQLLNFGFYPFTLAQHERKNKLLKLYLKRQWTKLKQNWHHHDGANLLFRLTDFTTDQLNQLRDAPQQEEINADLGLHGAARILLDSRWLKTELETIQSGWPEHSAVNLILPFVRNPLELTQLLQLIHQLAPKKLFHYWLEISTPATIFDLDRYPLRKLAGLIVNLDLLKAFSLGYDPKNRYLTQIYAAETTSVNQLLARLAVNLAKGAKNLTVILESSDYRYDVINQIVQHAWSLTSSLTQLTELEFKIKQQMFNQLTEYGKN